MMRHYALNLTKWSASLCADLMNGGTTVRLIRHSRVNGKKRSGIFFVQPVRGLHPSGYTKICSRQIFHVSREAGNHRDVVNNPCLKEFYIYKQFLDTRVRGYDDGKTFKFKVSKSKILLQALLNGRLLQLRDGLTGLQWAGGSND